MIVAKFIAKSLTKAGLELSDFISLGLLSAYVLPFLNEITQCSQVVNALSPTASPSREVKPVYEEKSR